MKKEIKERFNEIKEKNPYWSSWTCFVKSIRSKKEIRKYFKLVEKDDYAGNEKKELIKYLENLSVLKHQKRGKK